MPTKQKRTTKRTKQPSGYNIKPVTLAIYDELAQMDVAAGKRPKKNIAATLYEVGQAELQRRKAAQFPGDRELQREKEMSK